MTSGELDLDHVATLSDEELISELTAVKGIGDWSAHMFLMFQLERPDILATGDLGVRKGAQRAYGLEELPSPPSSRRSASRGARSAAPGAACCGGRSTTIPAERPQAASDQ